AVLRLSARIAPRLLVPVRCGGGGPGRRARGVVRGPAHLHVGNGADGGHGVRRVRDRRIARSRAARHYVRRRAVANRNLRPEQTPYDPRGPLRPRIMEARPGPTFCEPFSPALASFSRPN